MFWNFIGMFLTYSLDVWSLLQKIMQYKLAFFYCDSMQMLKFCELDQFSFLDEVATGARSMQLTEQVAAKV
jgi:hypothetical protein